MITLRSEVFVKAVSGRDISEFMINCTDEDYQCWWPGVHLRFHTTKRTPGIIGSRVFFDEYVGIERLKFKGVITSYVSGKEITWQLIKGVKLPAWLCMRMNDSPEGVLIIHDVSAGFRGIGRIFDPFMRLILSKKFEKDLDHHARTEFPMLGELLIKRKKGEVQV